MVVLISFESDYIQGAHEKVLERLFQTNMEAHSGYGEDVYSKSAKEKILSACNLDCEQSNVFFLSGGTQTNQIVIDTLLKPFEGVVCADTGHINTHEAGAIEFCGHKVLTLSNNFGKINPTELRDYVSSFYADENHEHSVFPGMVYISHPTEYGTLYSLNELNEISSLCEEYGMKLYLDGARLGYGLMSSGTDLSLADIAELCDAFYIGGTKVGALCGEALVFTNYNTPARFMTQIKQHGALLAKGRLLGVQFDTLFTNGLYFEISKHAITMADKMRKAFIDKGYEFYIETVTNQIFVVLENEKLDELRQNVAFGFWERLDENRTVVRFASSWATTDEDINMLLQYL